MTSTPTTRRQIAQRTTAVSVEHERTTPALADSSAAALSAAAARFMSRPEIAATIFRGSNGYSARLPARTEVRLDLWRQWPEMSRCVKLADCLGRALAEPANAAEIGEAVAGMIAAFPTGDRAPLAYTNSLAALLTEEAATRGWSEAAVVRGLLAVLRASRFMPAPAEAMAAVAEAHRELRHAAWAARKAAELAAELKWSLIDAGALEDDGEDF